MKNLRKVQYQLLICFFLYSSLIAAQDKIMVFSKTDGYRHPSIEVGIEALEKLIKEKGYEMDATENSELFISTINQYAAVIFLNTTKNVFTDEQQVKFKNYMENGGGFVGIHAATDTEFDWEWYGEMVGAYFSGHPEKQNATLHIENCKHSSTVMLGKTWEKYDEWYNFKNINPNIKVLMSIDESSYEGGTNGKDHPIAWCQEVKKGKMFYTGLGHTKESYSDPKFLAHVWGGIEYVLSK